jgi:methylated-DNA-[protein]-cysteine S-methyltransferase
MEMTSNNDIDLIQGLADAIPAPTQTSSRALRARLVARAEREGLLDVAYASVGSPVGELMLVATRRGVVRIAFASEALDDVLDQVAEGVSARVLEAPARLDDARRQLDEYFEGARTSFELALDWSLTRGFRRDVLLATARIPYGDTGTYRSVARSAGNPSAVRAAGSALATNPMPIIVPCHRVLRSDGSLGGYRGGIDRKQLLLRHEHAENV